MFERELIDGMFIDRWSIVRTLMSQSVAEHSYLVAHYSNDIAQYLCLGEGMRLSVLQYALWHDAGDEIFTGDMPGPSKRALLEAVGPDAKFRWDRHLGDWARRVFDNLDERMGGKRSPDEAHIVKLVVKTADWLEAATRMATEAQMGNRNAAHHVEPNMIAAVSSAYDLCDAYFATKINRDEVPHHEADGPGRVAFVLATHIEQAVSAAAEGRSKGPFITREDDKRTGN